MKKPNFFIVGVPRSGKTALYFYLKRHPDILMCDHKEPYYFCTDFHEESDNYFKRKIRFPIRTKEQYLRLFKNTDHYKIIGEATPDYLYSKIAAKNICSFNPDAKILISLRNPVDFLCSLHAQLLYHNGEDISDFKKALDIEPERCKGRYMPKGLLWPSSLYYSERIKFSEQIKRYLDLFPKEQIKIIIYDDFKEDNLKIFRNILRFLHVNDSFVPSLNIYNPDGIPRFTFINRFLTTLGILEVKNILPHGFRKSFNMTIRKLNRKPKKIKPLDHDLHNKLMQNIKPEIENLSILLGRDLVKLWCEEKPD